MLVDYEMLTDSAEARRFLARSLAEGNLTLFLGAGASAGAGLPDWSELVSRLCARAGIPASVSKATAAPDLQALADDAEARIGDRGLFLEYVTEALYESVELTDAQLDDRLLIALGAMMMGSRRGSVRRVVSFNFDSVLEWYVGLCGFVPRVAIKPTELEGAEDVRIYHPHGFLPHPSMASFGSSDFAIFGLESVNTRLGKTGDPWFELLRHLLRTSVCLFVGLSFRTFRDPALAPLITTVSSEVQRWRPLGFWTLCDAIDRTEEKKREMLRQAIVPLEIEKEGVSQFLLEICQEASRGAAA